MTAQELNDLAARVHLANKKWWLAIETGEPIKRNIGELLMLTVSELAEAMEGDRKNLQDDKLPHRKMFEVELADAIIRLLDMAGGLHLEFKDRHGTIELKENVAENLLQIIVLLVRAYWDAFSPLMFALWIEKSIQAIEQLSVKEGLDIWSAFDEKIAYNAVRHDHTVEGRKEVGGKKY